jgi:hypothetical protein
LHSFRYIPRSEIARSHGRSMFSFLRSLHVVFRSDCTSLHSYKQCKRVLSSPHPHQNLLLVVFLMIAILTRVRCHLFFIHLFICAYIVWAIAPLCPFPLPPRWNLSVVLISISFMVSSFSCVFWPFEFLPLKKFYLVQLPISLLVH